VKTIKLSVKGADCPYPGKKFWNEKNNIFESRRRILGKLAFSAGLRLPHYDAVKHSELPKGVKCFYESEEFHAMSVKAMAQIESQIRFDEIKVQIKRLGRQTKTTLNFQTNGGIVTSSSTIHPDNLDLVITKDNCRLNLVDLLSALGLPPSARITFKQLQTIVLDEERGSVLKAKYESMGNSASYLSVGRVLGGTVLKGEVSQNQLRKPTSKTPSDMIFADYDMFLQVSDELMSLLNAGPRVVRVGRDGFCTITEVADFSEIQADSFDFKNDEASVRRYFADQLFAGLFPLESASR
jgi:hypothetical protein